eukprot:NODE_6721_length_823_cov_63.448571_g6485_i0.p1 GENE.NODE_6721_length_823_cov_63.448571_g6485_i0~~NODE_6721_length_823_cov_63.448571_g6485_i0.p1  ORF type:complete len:135 (-),score=6.08 NODE_6721_length_823_cov_63.448571_g6485_i0:193-597(-)
MDGIMALCTIRVWGEETYTLVIFAETGLYLLPVVGRDSPKAAPVPTLIAELPTKVGTAIGLAHKAYFATGHDLWVFSTEDWQIRQLCKDQSHATRWNGSVGVLLRPPSDLGPSSRRTAAPDLVAATPSTDAGPP